MKKNKKQRFVNTGADYLVIDAKIKKATILIAAAQEMEIETQGFIDHGMEVSARLSEDTRNHLLFIANDTLDSVCSTLHTMGVQSQMRLNKEDDEIARKKSQ